MHSRSLTRNPFRPIKLAEGTDFLKAHFELDDRMNELGIKNILKGTDIVSSTTSINQRSPTQKSFLQAEQELRYRTANERTTEFLITNVYRANPLSEYVQEASSNAMQAAGTIVNRDLLDINIPVPALANSVVISPSVRIAANKILYGATTQAQMNAALDPIFAVVAGTPDHTFAQTRAIAQEHAKILNRLLLPLPPARRNCRATLSGLTL